MSERPRGGIGPVVGVASVRSGWRAAGRAVVTALLAGLVLVISAGPAAAHNSVVSSDPADGAAIGIAPKAVTLTFNLPVQEFAVVTVTGPGETRWERGPARVAGNTVTTELASLGPAGRYVVAYRVLSEDGHPVSDTIDFVLTEPGSASSSSPPEAAQAPGNGGSSRRDAPPSSPAAPAAASEQGAQGDGGHSDMPVWPWLLGTVVLVGTGCAVALRLGRR